MEAREIVAPLILSRDTECHVTPPEVAARMVDYLGSSGDQLTLEPSAGTGALVQALINAGQSESEICIVEKSVELHRRFREEFPRVASGANSCFIEYAEKWAGVAQFPRIIMNPPFRQIRKHMDAALSLLGGEESQLVALVPITYEHPQAVTAEELPPGTFATTQARTKIITIDN